MALRDLIALRNDDSSPRDPRLRLGRIQTCVLDLGAADPENVREILSEAVERGFIEGFTINTKRGEAGSFASIIASTKQLARLNQTHRLGEMRRWHGAQQDNWPAWAKTTEGQPLNRWLGVE